MINIHEFTVKRCRDGFELPVATSMRGILIINGYTHLVHKGQLWSFASVKTGRTLTDRRTQVEYPETKPGFQLSQLGYLAGPVALLHPSPTVIEVPDGLILEMAAYKSKDGEIAHFYDVQHNVCWGPYTAEERLNEFGDSERSLYHCTQMSVLSMSAHRTAQGWNSLRIEDCRAVDIGVRYNIVG